MRCGRLGLCGVGSRTNPWLCILLSVLPSDHSWCCFTWGMGTAITWWIFLVLLVGNPRVLLVAKTNCILSVLTSNRCKNTFQAQSQYNNDDLMNNSPLHLRWVVTLVPGTNGHEKPFFFFFYCSSSVLWQIMLKCTNRLLSSSLDRVSFQAQFKKNNDNVLMNNYTLTFTSELSNYYQKEMGVWKESPPSIQNLLLEQAMPRQSLHCSSLLHDHSRCHPEQNLDHRLQTHNPPFPNKWIQSKKYHPLKHSVLSQHPNYCQLFYQETKLFPLVYHHTQPQLWSGDQDMSL